MILVVEGNRLLKELNEELRLPSARRQSGVPDSEIEWAIDVVRQMLDNIVAGALPPFDERHDNLGYAIMDHWSYASPLAKELLAFEDQYRRL